MILRYRYRIYSAETQKRSLAQLFGCVRVVWNDALEFCEFITEWGRKNRKGQNSKRHLSLAPNKEKEREWLSNVSAVPLQQSINDLEEAYRAFLSRVQRSKKGEGLTPNAAKNASPNRVC